MLKKFIVGFAVGAGLIFANISPSYAYTSNPITINSGVDCSLFGDVIGYLNNNNFHRNVMSDIDGWMGRGLLCYENSDLLIWTDSTSCVVKIIQGKSSSYTDHGKIKIGSSENDVIASFGEYLVGDKYVSKDGANKENIGSLRIDQNYRALYYTKKDASEAIEFEIKNNRVIKISLTTQV